MARLTKRTPSGWALAAPCAPGVPLAMLARYENIGSAHQFRHLSELNTPKSPYPDGDTSILECPCCGSGEWLHNADESAANFCGQCGQAIDWTEPEVHCRDCEHLTFSDCYGAVSYTPLKVITESTLVSSLHSRTIRTETYQVILPSKGM